MLLSPQRITNHETPMSTLYLHPMSQHSRRVVSLLEEAQIPYEGVVVALDRGAHMAPEFLALNPNHQVPVYVDAEATLCESNAILRYLCMKHGLKDWYPEDLSSRARVEQWLDWNQTQLSPAVVGIVFNTLFAGDKANPRAIERGRARLKDLAPILEDALADNDYIAGARPTIADLSLASNIFHLGMADVTLDSPHIAAWYGRMQKCDGFRKSLPGQGPADRSDIAAAVGRP